MKVSLALATATAVILTIPVAAGPVSADPAVSGEFAVAGGLGTNAQISPGPDGNMWVTVETGNDVARVAPDGTVTEFDASDISFPVGITAGPDGNMWVTQNGAVARFAPGNPTAATKFPIAEITDPRAITAGSDGNLWTASADKVIRIPPANPAGYTVFATTGVSGARWITSSPDGSLWVADFAGGRAVNVSQAGVGTPYQTPGGPQGVAAGEGGQVAYSNPNANPQEIGRITPGGAPAPTQTPSADPFGVAFGADKAYWFAEFAGNVLGRLTPDGTYTTVGGFSPAAGPRQLAAGPGNTLWVVLDTAEKVARVTGVAPVTTPTPTPVPTLAPTPVLTVAPTPVPTVTPPPNLAPAVLSAVRHGSKLRIRIPTTCSKQFRFRIQRARTKAGVISWRNTGRVYRTKGKAHLRTINRGKGTYRAVVLAACGFERTTTAAIKLKR